VAVLREEQLRLHPVRPFQSSSAKQAAELRQQISEVVLTHQEHLAAAVEVAPASNFVQE
jgi:light-regulated signal transduction histidine kinase (bacteriophytochrome)